MISSNNNNIGTIILSALKSLFIGICERAQINYFHLTPEVQTDDQNLCSVIESLIFKVKVVTVMVHSSSLNRMDIL